MMEIAEALGDDGAKYKCQDHLKNNILEAIGKLKRAAKQSEPKPHDHPYEEREKMTMKLMKLWVVQLEPSMCGPRDMAEKALRDNSIMPVKWESDGLILLPPALQEAHVPTFFDTIKKSIEQFGTRRAELYYPYGLGGRG